MQANLGYKYKFNLAPCSTPIQEPSGRTTNADATILGAFDILNALVAGLNKDRLEAPTVSKPIDSRVSKARLSGERVVSAPKIARSPAQCSFPSRGRLESPISTSSPQTITSFAHVLNPTSTCTIFRHRETFETSEHNKDRIRATLARTRSLYVPGSCVRPSGQLSGSQGRTVLYGSDGVLNVALYPKAMLVKLATFEGDDMVDSTISDPEETVQGAIERLSALVNGLGYDWVNEPVSSGAHRIKRGESMESMCSNTTASSGPHPTTPRDELCFSEVFGKY